MCGVLLTLDFAPENAGLGLLLADNLERLIGPESGFRTLEAALAKPCIKEQGQATYVSMTWTTPFEVMMLFKGCN